MLVRLDAIAVIDSVVGDGPVRGGVSVGIYLGLAAVNRVCEPKSKRAFAAGQNSEPNFTRFAAQDGPDQERCRGPRDHQPQRPRGRTRAPIYADTGRSKTRSIGSVMSRSARMRPRSKQPPDPPDGHAP